MIQIQNLTKRYGQLTAVDSISLEIREREAFGLLGPNGAGKTTTLHMLMGALKPDAGKILVDGRTDPTQTERKRQQGLAPQDLALYETLTGEENLRFFARIYGLRGSPLEERVKWALDFAGLEDRRRDRCAHYSGGMKRRLNLACALVHEPRVLFLDEPTVGVDPQSRNHILDRVEALKRDGCTLIFTTHYMEEAERICDRVAIMDHGRILAVDTVEGLIAAHGGPSRVEVEFASLPERPDSLPGTWEGPRLAIQTESPLDMVVELGRQGHAIQRLRVDRPDLERVFLNLTGRSLRD
jgi:linearmycin/streptolysin S transport system ATP-binding protein